MPEQRTREMQGLASHRRHEQLQAHLETFEIATAKVPGVGRAKVATLLSFGIETAADVDPARVEAVPGFGPKTAAALVAFRQACEASFHYDANLAITPAKVAAMDGMLGQRRAKIESELAAGPRPAPRDVGRGAAPTAQPWRPAPRNSGRSTGRPLSNARALGVG